MKQFVIRFTFKCFAYRENFFLIFFVWPFLTFSTYFTFFGSCPFYKTDVIEYNFSFVLFRLRTSNSKFFISPTNSYHPFLKIEFVSVNAERAWIIYVYVEYILLHARSNSLSCLSFDLRFYFTRVTMVLYCTLRGTFFPLHRFGNYTSFAR